MSAAAQLEVSEAILKIRYPEGRLPKANYQNFKHVAMLQKREDFSGESKVVAIQTENPQGSSANYQIALQALEQGTYVKFTVTPVNHYGIARIRGDALKRAASTMGALVDLWKNETDGISMTEVKGLEIASFRDGTGIVGQTTGSLAGQTVVTLTKPADIVNFDLGMSVNAVGDTTLSPVVRNGAAKIIGIDRKLGTLTFASAIDGQIIGIQTNDYLVRAGDYALGGVSSVITGTALWIAGGSNPSTLFGRVRNTDPVRLAGQAPDLTGINMEDALIEAEALLVVQGFAVDELTCWANPLTIKELKKTVGGKVTYPRDTIKSTIPGISFKAYEFEGDNGTIKIISNPFYPIGGFLFADMNDLSLDSMGPAPHLQDYDTNKFLRTGTDDTWQVAFATYGQLIARNPVKFLRGLNWGA